MKTRYVKTIAAVLLMTLPVLLNAQKPEGHIKYLMTQNWAKKMLAVDYMSQQARDRINYMWGGSRAEWKQYAEMYFTVDRTLYFDSEEEAERDMDAFSYRKDEYFITRNFTTQSIHDVLVLLDRVYIIDDSIKSPDWKILNDMKDVAGHICMNAYYDDTLKKQKVIAWYALDIPVSGGPERFCGLPGMILEVNINNGAMVITAESIDLKALTGNELELPKKFKGKKINEEAYRQKLKNYFDERRKAEEPPFWGIRY